MESAVMLSQKYRIASVLIEQKAGYFTHALNLGKDAATGDIIVFTDSDAMPPRNWISNYSKLFAKMPKSIAGISSRDFYYNMLTRRKVQAKDDLLRMKLYRLLVRTWLQPPIALLKKYRFGVYLTRSLDYVQGPFLPHRYCCSLPYRGANMGFRRESIDGISFPEDVNLVAAPGNEQYLGLRLVLNGFDLVYVPFNYVWHVDRPSLSRGITESQLAREITIMKRAYLEALEDA
jgi:cellulose synthase/poly-beta-1,6-N-acetylglucosamine synthase-like glycosyltransferase